MRKTKNKKRFVIRSRYELKRRKEKWKKKKKIRKKKMVDNLPMPAESRNKKYHKFPAPSNFSFINNTNEVLDYFHKLENKLRRKENVNIDISDIEILSSDAIALLVASLNDVRFHHNSNFQGNAPKDPVLKKIFVQSGFHNFVNSRGFSSTSAGCLLHKEKNYKVDPKIAMQAALNGIQHTFKNNIPNEPLYEILIECMSNTKAHAAGSKNKEQCYWWLYVYNDPKSRITSYSLFDLGVGIFKSMIVKNYIRKKMRGGGLLKNIDFVDDLLKGTIQSRVEMDNEIRGKGIPQIVEHSKLAQFKEFFLITNDLKINLKTGTREELNNSISGTFYYWEITN